MIHESVLLNWQQAHTELSKLAEWLKPRIMAGHSFVVMLDKPKRSSDQNAKLHAMLNDIARQVEWAGKKRSIDAWKRLCVAAWLRAEGESVEILPAIDGHSVDIVFERTSRMTKPQIASLIEYIFAWGVEHGVNWSNHT